MSGMDSQSSIANMSPTGRYGHAEQTAAETDLVTEGEFRRSIVKVSPSFVVKVSPHILPMGNHDSHAYEVEWKVADWWPFLLGNQAFKMVVTFHQFCLTNDGRSFASIFSFAIFGGGWCWLYCSR